MTNCEIVKETPTTVVMDANNGMGMVASHKMMEMRIEKAKVYGLATGTIFNSTHYGICCDLWESEKALGQERIYTAGEKEWLSWQERKDLSVPVGETIQKEFMALRDECVLNYKFPFEA